MVTGWKGLFRRRKSFIKITSCITSPACHPDIIAVAVILTGCEHNPVLLSSGFSTSPGDTATSPGDKGLATFMGESLQGRKLLVARA